MEKAKYFYGNKISEYGVAHGFVDYRTLAKCGDAVLCNDITKLFYTTIDGEYSEPKIVNGFIDNTDKIQELEEKLDELKLELKQAINRTLSKDETLNTASIEDEIERIEFELEDLKEEQDNQGDIYQHYIISDSLASILINNTNEIVYYIECLDIYIWGVTHWGTSWDYVLTDIKIDW